MARNKIKIYRYTKLFKIYETELTWDLFINRLKENGEFTFYYNSINIDICYDYSNGRKYMIIIENDGTSRKYAFSSIDDLINEKIIDNKTLYELWDDLEN